MLPNGVKGIYDATTWYLLTDKTNNFPLFTVEEYLSSFLLLGYTMDGERVILQGYESPKDKDAVMEFLKNVFIQQHQGEVE
jgi:hypothetical protein